MTLQPEQSGGQGSIPGRAPPLKSHDKGSLDLSKSHFLLSVDSSKASFKRERNRSVLYRSVPFRKVERSGLAFTWERLK